MTTLAGLLGACVLLATGRHLGQCHKARARAHRDGARRPVKRADPRQGQHFSLSTQNVLIVAMGLVPLLAGIREAYSYKKADKELIKQFRFMSRLFDSCRTRLQASRSDAETRQLLFALGRACLEEHAEWILLHRERPLEHAQLT